MKCMVGVANNIMIKRAYNYNMDILCVHQNTHVHVHIAHTYGYSSTCTEDIYNTCRINICQTSKYNENLHYTQTQLSTMQLTLPPLVHFFPDTK